MAADVLTFKDASVTTSDVAKKVSSADPLPVVLNGLPASLGATTMSESMSVTIATDDARIGIVTETAPATDTASSGLNGRLQRIAQRLTSLIAVFTGGVIGGGITYTDKTITSASGSSQTLAAANASRKSILIKNGASSTGVNINGGTAAIGGAATITLQAYEGLFLSGPDCPVGTITVISTAAAYISAFEGA